MKKIFILGGVLGFFACGGGGGGSSAFSEVTEATMTSVPMIKDSEDFTTASVLAKKKTIAIKNFTFVEGAMDSEPEAQIKQFFKLECHMNTDRSNFCPDNLNPAPVYSETSPDEYKLTIGTLIGLIYHAVMYGENIYSHDDSYKTCATGDNAATLTANTPYFDGATSHNFILNIPNFFDCVSSFNYDGVLNYTTYYKAEAGDRFGIITARKSESSSDITEVYASQLNAAGVPTLIASNSASYNTMNNRSIILANVETHKFVSKYQTVTNTSQTQTIIAIGKAGVNSDGIWVDGYYLVKSVIGDTTNIYCIHNAEIPVVSAASNCSDIIAELTLDGTDSWSNADIAGFMGLEAPDTTYLANFINILKTGEVLNANLVPSSASQFPSVISASR